MNSMSADDNGSGLRGLRVRFTGNEGKRGHSSLLYTVIGVTIVMAFTASCLCERRGENVTRT